MNRKLAVSLYYKRTGQEGGHLQVRKRVLTRTPHAGTLISDFQPPEVQENTFLLFKPRCLWYSVIAV